LRCTAGDLVAGASGFKNAGDTIASGTADPALHAALKQPQQHKFTD
jgi:hypothetical protein